MLVDASSPSQATTSTTACMVAARASPRPALWRRSMSDEAKADPCRPVRFHRVDSTPRRRPALGWAGR